MFHTVALFISALILHFVSSIPIEFFEIAEQTSKVCNTKGLLHRNCQDLLSESYDAVCNSYGENLGIICSSYETYESYVIDINSNINEYCLRNLLRAKRSCKELRDVSLEYTAELNYICKEKTISVFHACGDAGFSPVSDNYMLYLEWVLE